MKKTLLLALTLIVFAFSLCACDYSYSYTDDKGNTYSNSSKDENTNDNADVDVDIEDSDSANQDDTESDNTDLVSKRGESFDPEKGERILLFCCYYFVAVNIHIQMGTVNYRFVMTKMQHRERITMGLRPMKYL